MSKVEYTHNNKLKQCLKKNPTKEELMEFYTKWSDEYDSDTITHKANAAFQLSDAVCKLLADKKESYILNFACGTGDAGKFLIKQGFTNLEGLDGSEGMLQKALLKNCYRQVFQEFCEPGGLKSVADNTYNVVITTGCIGVPHHVDFKCIEGILKCLKVGGHFILGIRKQYVGLGSDGANEFERLQQNNIWRKISEEETPNYFGNDFGMIFIFQKQ